MKNGKYEDAVVLAMLKREWDILKEYYKEKIYGKQI